MKKINNLKAVLLSTAFIITMAPPVMAENINEGMFADISFGNVAKTAFNGGYDTFLKDQAAQNVDKLAAVVTVKLKQALWREGDLAALNNDGTFSPVVHQYKSLADWVLSYVLGSKERTVLNCTLSATNWFFNLEATLGKALSKKFGASTPEELINKMAERATKGLAGTIIDTALSPTEDTTTLTRGQILALESDLSTQGDREEELQDSYQDWGIDDWVGRIMFQFSNKVNQFTDAILDRIQDDLKKVFLQKQNELVATFGALAGGVVGAAFNPYAAFALGAGARKFAKMPESFLEIQGAKFDYLAGNFRDSNFTAVPVTADQVKKYSTTVVTTEEVDDFTVIDVKKVEPDLTADLKKFISKAYHDASDKRTKTRCGVTFKRRDAALCGAANVAYQGTKAVVGFTGRTLAAGASKVWGWFSNSNK